MKNCFKVILNVYQDVKEMLQNLNLINYFEVNMDVLT